MKETFLGNTRMQVYCAILLVCSLVSLPEDYKIDKSNILNQWFVKLGWFWTSVLVLPLLFSSIKINDRESVANAIFRIILSTILWFTSVNLFQFFDTTVGFDISGHTFLLIFSNLLISSEMRLSETNDSSQSGDSNDSMLTKKHKPKIKLILMILTILWDFMLLQTALYYHTIIQKLIAAIWAFGSWYIMHILFYDKTPSHSVYKSPRSRL